MAKEKEQDKKRKSVEPNNNNNNNHNSNNLAETSDEEKSSQSSVQSPKKFKTSNGRPSLDGISAIISKTLPEQIIISRKGSREYIDTPITYLQLIEFCREHYGIAKNKSLLFADLSNITICDEISYQKYLTTSGRNVLLCFLSGESKLDNGSEEILVDVTPSKNILLKAGTSEYNFPNAIAEFIDNSIQAVRLNEPGKRDIKVQINRPNTDLKTTSIRIWDNGCGMDKDHLQRWATMGLSQADLKEDENHGVANNGSVSPSQSKSLITTTSSSAINSNDKATGLISRFGVGGKKAAFYLGTEVIVNTKVKGNEWINQAKISLDILNSTGDQEWKIPIIVREAANAQERKFEQFTEVIINNVNMSVDNYTTILDSLGKDLAHIYYYYLHDVGEQSHYTLGDNNSPLKRSIQPPQPISTKSSQQSSQKVTSTQRSQRTLSQQQSSQQQSSQLRSSLRKQSSQSSKSQETGEEDQHLSEDLSDDYDSEDDEEVGSTNNPTDKTMTTTSLNNIGCTSKKNSYKLLLNDKDLSDVNDCIESQYIKEGKRFKVFEFSLPIKDPSSNIINQAKVVCHLRYFPFLDEHETMPIPNKILQDVPDMDIKNCPLSLRKPGFEVFWNGRLISEAHIERLGFMTAGSIEGLKIEEKWIQRVKGAIFLTSHFPVTHNKMHIIKESPVFELLNQPAAGGNKVKSDWKRWLLHCHKLDQDIQSKNPKYDEVSNKTYCEGITIRGLSILLEDAVSCGRRNIKGIIKTIYFTGRPDFRASDFYCEIDKLHYKTGLPSEHVLCSKITKKISKAEYANLLIACKKKLPSKIRFYEGDKANLPKSSYLAGEKIKWVSITLMDSQSPPKEVERKIIEDESYKIMFSVVYQPTGVTVHKMETSVFYDSSRVSFGDIDCFKLTGAYSLVFECNDRNVKKATHFLQVIADKPTSINATLNSGVEAAVLPENTINLPHRLMIKQTLPDLVLSLIDINKNIVPLPQLPKKLTFKAISEEIEEDPEEDGAKAGPVDKDADKMDVDNNVISIGRKKEIPISKPTSVTLIENQVIVKGLSIPRAELNDDSELPISILITMDTFKYTLSQLILTPGEPFTMTFTEQVEFLSQPDGSSKPNIDSLNGYMNLTYLPHFYVFVNDTDGNICRLPSKQGQSTTTTTQPQPVTRGRKSTKQIAQAQALAADNPPYYILVRSPSFDENIYYVGDEKGCFSLCTYNISGITRKTRVTPPPTAILINEKVDKEFETEETTSAITTLANKKINTRQKSTTAPDPPQQSFSLADVTFTLFKDLKELFTVSQKIKVLPSYKPTYISLYPLSDVMEKDDTYIAQASSEINFGIKVFSAGGGNRGPFILSGLSGTVLTAWCPNKTNFIMTNGSNSDIKATVQVTNTAGDMIILPTIVTDRTTRFSRYNISVEIPMSKQTGKEYQEMSTSGEGKDHVISLRKDFSIQTIGGQPTYFVCNLGRGVTQARCDSEITLEIGLNDRKHNPVQPINLKSDIPIDPWFELSNQPGQTSQIPCFIKSQVVGEFDFEKNIYPCKVTVVGFGKLTIKVLDRSQQIQECQLNFECIEGRAAQLCVNGSSQASIPCSGGQLLDEISFLVCDTQGNPTRSITGVDTELEWVDHSASDVPIEIKNRVKISKGEGKLTNLEVKPNAAEGTYRLRVKPKQLDILEAIVSFVVRGKFSIELLDRDNLPRITPTNSVCSFTVMLLNPDRVPMVVPKESMKLLTTSKTYACSDISFLDDDENKPVYIFNKVAFSKKAGPTSLTFTHTIRGTKGTKIQMEDQILVQPDYPTKLSICGQIKYSSTTGSLGEKIGIIATDAYENNVVVNGSIRVYIEASPSHPLMSSSTQKSAIELPSFVSTGNTSYLEESFKAVDGEATFNQIKLRDSIGSSGPFQLVFTPSIPSVPSIEPLRIEFFYQNQKESLDKKVKLQQQRVLLSSEIKELDKEVDELKDQQNKIFSEYNNAKSQADEVFNQLSSLIPTIGPDAKTNPDTIKKLITQTNHDLDELSNRPRRRSPYPSNPTSRELLDKSRSNPDSGIVGVIMDLFCVEDERLGQCLSNFLKAKMEGVVFQNKFKFDEYYNLYVANRALQPVFFVSLDSLIPFTPKRKPNSSQQSQMNGNQGGVHQKQLDISTFDGAPLNGFGGFVVNRIQLREKHEFLRSTLCFTLFKEMMVFNTVRQGLDYKNYLASRKIFSPPIICLENGEFLDTSGFVEIGRGNNSTRNWQFSLGQLPINETIEYTQLKLKKNVLEEYRLIKYKMHSNKKGEEIQDYINKIEQLKQIRKQKSTQLTEVTNEIQQLDESSNTQNIK